MVRQYLLTLKTPDGEEFDITERLMKGDLGRLTETLEETLTRLTHSDIALSLDDRDGFLENLFGLVLPTELWQVFLERETLTRRQKWELLFGGVLDLPWSLQLRPKDKAVQLQAFSYTKQLERSSGEDVRRTITGTRTLTVTAGSNSTTFNDSGGFKKGDTIRVYDSENDEEHTISFIRGNTVIVTTNFTNSFTAATVELLTIYNRWIAIDELAAAIFSAAGFTAEAVDIADFGTASPFLSTLGSDGTQPTDPLSFVHDGTTIRANWAQTLGGGSTASRTSASLASKFQDSSATVQAYGDWRPYRATAPGAILTRALKADGSVADDTGDTAWDYLANVSWWMTFDSTPDDYILNRSSGAPATFTLPEGFTGGTQGILVPRSSLDFCPDVGVAGMVWIIAPTKLGVGPENYKLFELDVNAGTFTTIATLGAYTFGAKAPRMRYSNALGRMVIENPFSGNFELWDVASKTIVANIPRLKFGIALLWTLRVLGGRIYMLYEHDGSTRLKSWDSTTFAEVGDVTVAAALSARAVIFASQSDRARSYLTIYRDPLLNRDVLIGYAGTQYFILDTAYSGVIDYADFSGLSCAEAAKEVAYLLGAYVKIDAYALAALRPRILAIAMADADAQVLDEPEAPLEIERSPVWEDYRSSVEIKGTRPDGSSVTVLVGDTGDSARRLSLTPKLKVSDSIAVAMATSFHSHFNTVRKEERMTIRNTGVLLRPLDHAWFESRPYLVVEAETDLLQEEQDLRLIELI